MTKITYRIALPIILVGLFATVIFIGLYYENLDLGFYFVFLLLSIFIFSFGFAIGQHFSSPIVKLVELAQALSEGKKPSRVYLETKDELAQLAFALNKIADELGEKRIDEEIIEKAVNLRTREQVQALNDTIRALEQKIRNRTSELEKMFSELKILRGEIKRKEKELAQLKSKSFQSLKNRNLKRI